VMYKDYQESYTTPVPYADTYGKTTSIIAIGVDINL
jgi:hypothetical protein